MDMSTNNSGNDFGRITGIFTTRESAEKAFEALRDRGYEKDQIDLIMTDETRKDYYGNEDADTRTEMSDKAMEGAGIGSAIGGTIGAIVGAVAAIGTSLVLPGLGLVIAGPIAAALAGAGAGGLTGGLLGALVGTGIPEDEARDYESRIKDGGTAIAVKPKTGEDAHFIRELFQKSSNGNVYDSHLRQSDPDYNADRGAEGRYHKEAASAGGHGYYGAGGQTGSGQSSNQGSSSGATGYTSSGSMGGGGYRPE